MSVNRKQSKKNIDKSLSQNDCKTKPVENHNRIIEKLRLNREIDIRPVRSKRSNVQILPDKRTYESNKTKTKETSSRSSTTVGGVIEHINTRTSLNDIVIKNTTLTKKKRINNKDEILSTLPVDGNVSGSSTNSRRQSSSADVSTSSVIETDENSSFEDSSKEVGANSNCDESSEALFKIANIYTITECSNDTVIKENTSSNEQETKSNSRKRKRINYASLIEGDGFDDTELEETRINSSSENSKDSVKSKKGRRKGYKNEIKPKTTEKESPENHQLKKKGRPRGKNVPNNSHCKMLMNTILQQLSNDQIDTTNSETDMDSSVDIVNSSIEEKVNTNASSATVTCAVCKQQMGKTAWTHHKYRNHNNLAWRIGDEPLDLSDSAVVMRVLTDLYKRKKPLYCENCNMVKKSVMGYLSHKSICQRSSEEIEASKVKCDHCGRTLMPVSMAIHLKICKVINVGKQIESPITYKSNDQFVDGKRKAAKKAEGFLKECHENDANEINKKKRRTWNVNFDFRSTPRGNKVIQEEINRNGNATCWFEMCNYESEVVDDMASHISNCKFKPSQGYTCKYCFVTYSNEDDALEHSVQSHSTEVKDEEFECNDMDQDQLQEDAYAYAFFDEPKVKTVNQTNKKNLLNGIHFLLKYRCCSTNVPISYPPAQEWTYDFCILNFSLRNIFPQWRMKCNDLVKLDQQKLSKYLPINKYSVCTASIQEQTYTDPLKLEYVWKRYKLFETDLLHNDTATIFCGGAITALAWLPTPYDDENCIQVLAVSSNSNFNKGYAIHQLYEESGLIQFWNCGTLKNSHTLSEKPMLQFCLAHDHGPVWCIEWCPSGCYDTDLQHSPQRIGVLAVGSADSYIYIYSICLPDPRSGKIFKLKPLYKLGLSSVTELAVNGIEAHVTKLSWTKAKGHNFLAAGYSNGMIAIFDLNSTSPLLKLDSNNDDVKIMLPYQILSAHHHAVTALYLYHLNDGRRWLMSGSLDRTIKYWDLENPLIPISNFTKFIVTDGVWLNHWISTVHTYEDCCGGGLTLTSVHQLRNFECISSSILHSNSCVSSISGSDWTNSFLQGNAAGEICGFFPHQFFYYLENDKSFRLKKGVLGYARVVEKDMSIEERIKNEKIRNSKLKQASSNNTKVDTSKECLKNDRTNYEPTDYEEADDKYGLVFCDMTIDSIKDLPANLDNYCKSNTDKFYPSRPHMYPLQSINQIVVNPNSKSYCYYATGYQAGFVRISSIKCLKKNSSRR